MLSNVNEHDWRRLEALLERVMTKALSNHLRKTASAYENVKPHDWSEDNKYLKDKRID